MEFYYPVISLNILRVLEDVLCLISLNVLLRNTSFIILSSFKSLFDLRGGELTLYTLVLFKEGGG